ncbi:MAG: ROK family protein [Bacteroidota bacterium]|nr:ROK family protein [Bacteroidota bacterium]
MAQTDEKILCIDIGGSHIKATIVNYQGEFLHNYEREKTPSPPSPENLVKLILEMASRFQEYDKVTAGFPGFIKKGVVKTAPKLGNDLWKDYDLKNELQTNLKKPTLVINDADLQGLSIAEGKGVEMLITLGTGFGSAIMSDGILTPHLEISQHPITKRKNYNDYLGQASLDKVGKKKWNKRLKRVIGILSVVFNYDRLYISGGNAKLIDFELDDNIIIADNREGIKGGMVLWKQFGEE